jgi:hypothetical protein
MALLVYGRPSRLGSGPWLSTARLASALYPTIRRTDFVAVAGQPLPAGWTEGLR